MHYLKKLVVLPQSKALPEVDMLGGSKEQGDDESSTKPQYHTLQGNQPPNGLLIVVSVQESWDRKVFNIEKKSHTHQQNGGILHLRT